MSELYDCVLADLYAQKAKIEKAIAAIESLAVAEAAPKACQSHPGKRAGGLARAASMTPEKRSEVARKAAAARWDGHVPALPRGIRLSRPLPRGSRETSRPGSDGTNIRAGILSQPVEG